MIEEKLIQAGIIMQMTSSASINIFPMRIVEIISDRLEKITPPKNSAHRWLDFGISSGVESFTM